ncbi:MAG: hypothetical protein AAGC77_05375 [Pseudomonadota bacterium]
MNQPRKSALSAFLILAALGCADQSGSDPRYVLESCQRVALIDPSTGQSIVGVEDGAYHNERNRLYLSAYDRRAVERSVRRGATALPSGGLYAIPLTELFASGAKSLTPRRLLPNNSHPSEIRPHGIDFNESTNEITFLNRVYDQKKGTWTRSVKIERINIARLDAPRVSEEARCSANDVLAVGDDILASFDHAVCDWRAGLEDIFRLKSSGVSIGGGEAVYDQAAFANGLAKIDNDAIAVAATRENSVLFLSRNENELEETHRVRVPGGPDNLTRSEDGAIVAAVHPSMLRLAMNRRLGRGRAPSRIVQIEPESSSVSVLFDDPEGTLFSAATFAVETPMGLIAGSVTDEGVLACPAAADTGRDQ